MFVGGTFGLKFCGKNLSVFYKGKNNLLYFPQDHSEKNVPGANVSGGSGVEKKVTKRGREGAEEGAGWDGVRAGGGSKSFQVENR